MGESRFSSRVDDFMGCSWTLFGSFSWIEDMLGWRRFDMELDEAESDEFERADTGCSTLFKEYTDKVFNSSLTLRDFFKDNYKKKLIINTFCLG